MTEWCIKRHLGVAPNKTINFSVPSIGRNGPDDAGVILDGHKTNEMATGASSCLRWCRRSVTNANCASAV